MKFSKFLVAAVACLSGSALGKKREVIGVCTARSCVDDACEPRDCKVLGPEDPNAPKVNGKIVSCTG